MKFEEYKFEEFDEYFGPACFLPENEKAAIAFWSDLADEFPDLEIVMADKKNRERLIWAHYWIGGEKHQSDRFKVRYSDILGNKNVVGLKEKAEKLKREMEGLNYEMGRIYAGLYGAEDKIFQEALVIAFNATTKAEQQMERLNLALYVLAEKLPPRGGRLALSDKVRPDPKQVFADTLCGCWLASGLGIGGNDDKGSSLDSVIEASYKKLSGQPMPNAKMILSNMRKLSASRTSD